MSEGAQGIAILASGATLLSLPLHLRIRSFLLASLAAGTAASFVLQIADTVHRGYPDRFAPIALFFGAFWGFIISAAVGRLVRLARRERRTSDRPSSPDGP